MGPPTAQTCSAYLACTPSGDTYSAVAVGICLSTPNGAWSNCVRNCLIAKYRCNQSASKNVGDHAACFGRCALRGLPRPPRLPKVPELTLPELAPARPSLLSALRRWLLG